jgi:MFS family permease
MTQTLKTLIFPRELNFLFLSILLFAMAMGINLVTFPTVLNKNNVSPSLIGVAFTLDTFGGILMSFFLSKIVSHFTMMKTMRFAVFVYAAIILTIYFYQTYFLWAFLAFTMGSLWFAYVITRQSWLNMLVENNQRGVALGVFSTMLSAGIALGPVVVKFTGAENYLSFVISALLTLCSFWCLTPLKNKPQAQLEKQHISIKKFFTKNPPISLARFFLDFQTYFLLTFSVIFGVKIGLSYEAAGLLITAYMASGFCDLFVGFALKKWQPISLINFGFAGSLCCFASMIFIHNYHFLLAAYFVFGLFIACIFVSSFKASNDDYEKEKLVAANSTFQLVGSLGALFGSLVGGILFNIFGAIGFPITIVLSCAAYLAFLSFYKKNHSIS